MFLIESKINKSDVKDILKFAKRTNFNYLF